MPYKFNTHYSLLFKIAGFTDPFICIWLKWQQCVASHFWKLEVQNQGADTVSSFWGLWGEGLFQASFLGWWMVVFSLCFCTSSSVIHVCFCVHISSSYEDAVMLNSGVP